MPTGYTTAIIDGCTFEEFALGAARAFWALVTMRDEPQSAEIPEKFEPSPYYKNALKQAEEDLEDLLALDDYECADKAYEEYINAIDSRSRSWQRHKNYRRKYELMRAQVERWEPPTPSHVDLKRFMLEQIDSSIKFDCWDWETFNKYCPEPVCMRGIEWREHRKALLESRIVKCLKSYQAELERITSRTEWVRQLRDSLKKENR